ncbi:MAG: glycosyltransferase family 4 protein [Erysipelotrichaceae bacterium]|nr:glycosyltransferase family 4 protein [Erysipelotrichaceae bacterium]
MKKRILFTVNTISKSGIVNVVNNIASELSKDERNDVSILCTGIIEKDRINSNLKVYDLDISRYGRRKKYLYLIPQLKRFFKDHCFDYVVVSGMEFVSFYYLAAMNKKMKMIAWEHLNFHAGPKYRLEWIGKRIACRKFYKIICITKKDADLYADYCKNRNRIVQIYNIPYDMSSKGYNPDANKIITVAYLGEFYKGYDLLVDVAKELFKDNNDWSWDIYGEGKDREIIQSKIEKAGLKNKVILKGFADNIGELYCNYAMFVLTSRVEGMGMVLIEAQKNDLPVVSFDIECGPSDVIIDGKNGYLIKPFDTKDMAEKIRKLMIDKKTRISFSENSRMCHEEFDKKVILRKWNGLFNGI